MSRSDRPSAYTKLVTVRAVGASFLLPPLRLSSPCARSMTVTGEWEVTPCVVLSAMRKSQTQIPPSRPPVLSRLACCGSHVTVFTVLVCPRRICNDLPVVTSVTRAVWSPEQVASKRSSGDHWRSNIPFSWISWSIRFASAVRSRDKIAYAYGLG